MKKIKVAVVGINGFGNRHVTAFKNHKDAELVMLCDTNEEKSKLA